jgi:hypothetical protein
MSLLTVVANASGRMGLEPLTSVVANTNATAQRLYRLANESGRSLTRRFNWQRMTNEQVFVTVAQEEQSGVMIIDPATGQPKEDPLHPPNPLIQDNVLPADFDRVVNETAYNRSRTRPMDGPLTPQQWQALKSSATPLAFDAYRVRNHKLLIYPAPSAGEHIVFEYVSKNWVITAVNPHEATQDEFRLDTDEFLLDEEMLTLDIIWRYRASAGLNYAEAFRSAELVIADRQSRDGGGHRTLDLSRSVYRPRVMPPTIPEGNWTL